MRHRVLRLNLALALLAFSGFGCGKITLPVDFVLVGDSNTISLTVPFLGNRTFSSSLVGGAESTVQVDLDLFSLLSPTGIAATIQIDSVQIAGTAINLLGLNTGTICIYQDPANPSGGMALFRVLKNQADFTLTLNTLISVTDPQILALFPDPLPFSADIDQTIPVTLSDLLGLLGGTGSGLTISQSLESTLPDIPILGGSIVDASLTLQTADALPSDPLIDECNTFVAGLGL
jgi:hypothetical protein